MYVHGFGSSGQSGTVTRIREVFPNTTVIAPDLPIHPQEAMDLLRQVCETEKPDLIIGTSMGGMYAEMLYGYDRILVNPAFQMGDTMKDHGMIGAQHFSNPRQDGVQDFIVTKALVKEYKEMTEQCFAAVTAEERGRVWGLFGDEDTTVDTFDLFHQYYSMAIRFHGEHRMNDKSFMHSVVPVIRWVDDIQEGRQRPSVYIGMETLSNTDGEPRSSVQKTVRMLIERYQVMFVAGAPSDMVYYAETNDWLYDYINVPAWEHTVFMLRRDLLYGDYFIGMENEWSGMATHLQFGSDTFKTWDDIALYFDRLGGQ